MTLKRGLSYLRLSSQIRTVCSFTVVWDMWLQKYGITVNSSAYLSIKLWGNAPDTLLVNTNTVIEGCTPFFYPHFSVLQNAIHKKTRDFLFCGFFFFFVRILKPEKSMVFFKIRQKKGLWIAWSKRLESCVKLMFKNSISEFMPTQGIQIHVLQIKS